jgi:Na+-translocating ferredoxin:NAD+ oxidoreductase subunit E
MMLREELKRGIITENPLVGPVLGLCPALAVTTSALNAAVMGITVIFALTCSSATISLVKRWIPERTHIPCYVTIIAAFVTVADMIMKALSPGISNQLGIYVPLIAANCIIMSRAETYASRNNIIKSIVDGIATGTGFLIALLIVGSMREIIGNNTLFGLTVISGFHPMTIFLMAPGGFFTIAFIVGAINFLRIKKEKRAL